MEASSSISSFKLITTPTSITSFTKPHHSLCLITAPNERHHNNLAIATNTTTQTRCGRKAWKTAAIEEVSAAITDPGPVDLTWQIVVGAIAGVAPFVVAGIEFSKRIIAQQRCKECGGSGLVLAKKNYMKCPECGGFLPWQSWRRFFTG